MSAQRSSSPRARSPRSRSPSARRHSPPPDRVRTPKPVDKDDIEELANKFVEDVRREFPGLKFGPGSLDSLRAGMKNCMKDVIAKVQHGSGGGDMTMGSSRHRSRKSGSRVVRRRRNRSRKSGSRR